MRIKTILTMLIVCATMSAQQLAFPEAQGWGRYAEGGRQGTVYHVTNLNDSGSGSLRDAVSQPNRIVVFDVAGVIRINSRIVFENNLYVAGQTAPGEGITVYGDGVSFSGADNIICRYMRFRMGAVGSNGKDAANIANGQNMIFDHCSFSWGQDENFSINWDYKGTAPKNITLQNSIVGQGLMTNSAGGLMQAENISLYRILLVDNSTRNFKVKGVNQYVNNLVYNWKNYAYNMGGDSEGASYVNIESNLFINGPAVGGDALTGGNSDFHFYGADNWQDSNRDGVYNPEDFTGDGGGDRQAAPYAYPELEKWSAKDLIEKLLPEVGASLPYRDLADCYMVDEVLSFGKKGNLITNEKELPIGVPTSWLWFKGEKAADTDGDGMPDWWEETNGTDKTKDDAMTIAANGYANIENYINSITKADRQEFLRAPLLLELTASTTNSLTLSWADYSDNEEGFIVEIQKDGAFVEAARTTGTSFTIADADLKPAAAYVVRVCAYQGEKKSDYTAELTVKTRPEQVDIIDAETFDGTGDGEWLIAPTQDETVTMTEAKDYKAVVVRSEANVTLGGTGYISGSASLNKTGNGTLTIATDQQYEGASVLHKGTWEFSTLKNGGEASGLGKSQEFAQNWVMDGGTYNYMGATTATNRSAKLYSDTEFDITNNAAVVTMNGSFEGDGNLTIGGEGKMVVNNADFFQYAGDLIVKGGEVNLGSKAVSDNGIGTAKRLVLAGGKFSTVGKNEAYVTYKFPIVATAGTTSTIDFDLWNENQCSVSGSGNLIWNVHYLREYISGDWSGFTGQLIINGTGKSGQSQFSMSNSDGWEGIKNATIYLKGNAQICGTKNESTRYIGGLSGDKGTFLSGFNVKGAGEGTYIVGTANTNETFNGVIDNRAQGGQEGKTSIVKEGTGDWRLTGENTYSGTTEVNGGTFIVNGQHTGTGVITISKGAKLAGTGTLAATVTLNGTLLVGDTLATDKGLTFQGGLKLDSTSVLQLNKAMTEATYYNGSELKVLTGIVTGTFAQILPKTPGEGQTWDTNDLYSKGILRVVGVEMKPVVTPIIICEDKKIVINTTTTAATIYYTLDGSTPTKSSTLYTDPITLTQNCTVKAIAVADGYEDSEVAEFIVDWFNGTPEPYAVLSDDNTVLTFYYDNQKDARGGMSVGPFNGNSDQSWSDARESITTVVFDDSFASYTTLTSTAYWFYNCKNLQVITGLDKLNTANVTNMGAMFQNIEGLTSLDLSSFNTTNVTNMTGMFYGCPNLTSLDVSGFNTANVTNMNYMFGGCSGLTNLDVSGFNTANVTNMNYMFYKCSGLTSLDLSGFNTANVTTMNSMFLGCSELNTIYGGSGWSTEAVTNGENMFSNCTSLVGGQGTAYDADHTDYTYAHVDGGTQNPGYLTPMDGYGKVAKPTFTHEGNLVFVNSATEGAIIRYTIDDEAPTDTTGIVYSDSIRVTRNCTIRAIAFRENFIPSEVAEYNVNWFKVTDVMFAQDGYLVSLSCSTDDATIHYSISGNTEQVYDGTPITITDDCWIEAYATQEGYNNSDTIRNEFKLADVTVVAPNITRSGDYVKMSTTTEQAAIYYTMDGTEPTANSILYTDSVLLSHNGTIKAIALRENYYPSIVTLFVADWFEAPTVDIAFDGRYVTINSDNTAVISYRINGGNVVQYTGGKIEVPGLCTIHVTAEVEGMNTVETDFDVNSYFDGRTAKVRDGGSFSEAFQWCGTNAALNDITAIVWNKSTALSNSDMQDFNNPNLLLYVNNKSLAPGNVKNVVVGDSINGYKAQQIVLKDTESGNGNFFCPIPFTANRITYEREFIQYTQPDSCRGWETIVLPFAVQSVMHERNGALTPFAGSGEGRPFWLRELTTRGFIDAAQIEANKPYIISMPNYGGYDMEYQLGGWVTFSAYACNVPKTILQTAVDSTNTIRFIPAVYGVAQGESVYALNVGEEYMIDHKKFAEGSVFVAGLDEVRPFRCYTQHVAAPAPGYHAPRYIPLAGWADGSTTSINEKLEMRNEKWGMTNEKWYMLDGRKLQSEPRQRGVYILNNKKIKK